MSGDMLWYEGPGVYNDGVKVAEIEVDELLQVILDNLGYTVVRVNNPRYPLQEKNQ